MKKVIILLLAVAMMGFAGCAKQVISGEVDEDAFYDSISYTSLLKKTGAVKDTETLYLADGTTLENSWWIEKDGTSYKMILEYTDATVYFTGNDTFIDTEGKLFYLSHFGWPLDSYRDEYLDMGPAAPSVDFSIKRVLSDGLAKTDKSYTVSVSYTVGDLVESFADWNLTATDIVEIRYHFDKDGALDTIQTLCGSTVLSDRVFTYNEKASIPENIASLAASTTRHTVTYTLHDGTDETLEYESIPDGLPIYCGTGYKFFTDWAHENEIDYPNFPITNDITLTVWY